MDLGDIIIRDPETDPERATTAHIVEDLFAHVGHQVPIGIDVEHLSTDTHGIDRRLESDLFTQRCRFPSDHFRRSAPGQMASGLYKHASRRKGHMVLIQFHGKLKGFLRHSIEQKTEDAIVRTDEILPVMARHDVGCLPISFGIYTDNVDGAFGECGVRLTEHERRLAIVERFDIVAYVNDLGLLELGPNGTLDRSHIVVLQAHIHRRPLGRSSQIVSTPHCSLIEKELSITGVEPVEVLGANDTNLRIIRTLFPKLSIIARGETLILKGTENDIGLFEERFEQLIEHVARYNELPRKVLDDIMGTNGPPAPGSPGEEAGVLVHGNAGLRVKARTRNQEKMVEATETSDMVFAIGPAGTGKTYTAVALAVRALKERKVRRIILTRPAVEAGENLGFLPGDLREKLDPYLQPLYDALREMIPASKLADHLDEGVIQIAPLAFMRGRTLDHAFVILDEAQNATLPQLKMFLTRMGRSAKFVITGDVTQVDLPERQPSGLMPTVAMLRGVDGINVVELDEKDVIRHELVTKVLVAFRELEERTDKSKRK